MNTMPALSQNLLFTVNSTSTTIVNYPNTGTTALTFLSNKVKGDGYFGGSDGFHTVQIQVSNFIGKLEMQATLASEPTETDWFGVELGSNSSSVDTTGVLSESNITYVSYNQATTNIKTYNFTGNFVWVRSKISEFTQGSVNSVKYNH